MQNAPISPAGTRSESSGAFPATEAGQASHALTGDPDRFDPARWLSDFERLGGGWVLRDRLSLVVRVEYQCDEDLSQARQMIVDLSDDQRPAIVAHLRDREA